MLRKNIYCLDCEQEFIQELKLLGFDTITGYLGYHGRISPGNVHLPVAPNECDVFVFNLTNPAFFDAIDWGPDGSNDNGRFKLVSKIDESFYKSSGKKYPRFKLLQSSHIAQILKSTFHYEDIQKAIYIGGIDCIFYLNPEYMFHSLYFTPNWPGVMLETDLTKSVKWSVRDEMKTICKILERIGTDVLTLRNPIEYKLLKNGVSLEWTGTKTERLDLITNNINDALAVIIKFGKGFIYFIPPFIHPDKGTAKLVNEILPEFKKSFKAHKARSENLQFVIGTVKGEEAAEDNDNKLDDLTGLFSKGFIDKQFSSIIEETIKKELPVSIIMCDVDYFKSVNDKYGHQTGDDVLKVVSGKINKIVGEKGKVVRCGGEEICIILPNYNIQETHTLAERIRKEIEAYVFKVEDIASAHLGEDFKKTISLGVSTSHQVVPHKVLLSQADQALLVSKSNGRNQINIAKVL